MTAWTCRQFAGKAAQKIVPRRPRNPCWKGLRADSEEKREPVSDIDPGVVNSLKALDPERPIREAVIVPTREMLWFLETRAVQLHRLAEIAQGRGLKGSER